MGTHASAAARYFIHYPNGCEGAYIIYAVSDPAKVQACEEKVEAFRGEAAFGIFGEIYFLMAAVKAPSAAKVSGDPEDVARIEDRAAIMEEHRDGFQEAIEREVEQLQAEVEDSNMTARQAERRLQLARLIADSAGCSGSDFSGLAPATS